MLFVLDLAGGHVSFSSFREGVLASVPSLRPLLLAFFLVRLLHVHPASVPLYISEFGSPNRMNRFVFV